MIYPIVIYGDPILKKRAEEIKKGHPGLADIIRDMYETMEAAHGIGLAAPQIGKSIRLFVVDATAMEDEDAKDFKQVFINPEILEEGDEEWKFEEGCLSIPGIKEDVYRPDVIKLKYYDENFKQHIETFDGIKGRIIQHEYDHIDGVLFIEHISAFKKSLLRGKLKDISNGKLDAKYPVKVYHKRK